MKILKLINLVLLILLSLASGVAKVMLTPQEVKFFGDAGFSDTLILLFGAAQLLGGFFSSCQNCANGAPLSWQQLLASLPCLLSISALSPSPSSQPCPFSWRYWLLKPVGDGLGEWVRKGS